MIRRMASGLALAAAFTGACSSGGHAGARDAGAGMTTPASCMVSGTGRTDCGGESCCTSLSVPAGSFLRSYDGVTTNGADKGFGATISSVSVDRYEVTVGRFREFSGAVVGGYAPASGSGKHAQLSGGKGLNGGTEPGWDTSWSASLATTDSDWNENLACDPTYATWTAEPGSGDLRPINCVTWFEAYAFCIWDGGFLPTEAEWNYTAAGGSDQRVYPWSALFPPGSTTLACSYADYAADWPKSVCDSAGIDDVGSQAPAGDGKWGHSDLAGNVFEWTLDWYASPYPTTSCDDCANLTEAQYRVIRGGSFDASPYCLLNALRETSAPTGRSSGIGFRCARPP
jgi:formylglycine-generating enzyme